MSSILIVEDNNELLHYLCTVLRSAGHSVIGAASGKRGLDALRENSYEFDLMLLDVTLGDMTAFEFLDEVKAENSLFSPQLCFVSSRRDADTVKAAVNRGAGDYIVKPVLSGTLIDKVSKLLRETVKEARFSSATCSFRAELQDFDQVRPDLTVTEVSETGIRLRSSAMLQEGAMLNIIVDELQRIIDHDGDHLIFRVQKCERTGWGKYQAVADFVGMGEDKLVKIRAFTIRGSFLPTGNAKKPA